MKDETLHINCHIEKTAGTTVLQAIENIYGKDKVYHFNSQAKKLVRADQVLLPTTNPYLDKIYRSISGTVLISPIYKAYAKAVTSKLAIKGSWAPNNKLPKDARAIHGHFPPSMFGYVKRPKYMSVVIRNPLDRMYSQYKHWMRVHGITFWRFPVQYDPEVQFDEFAFLPQLQNFQTKALGGANLKSFDLVGVTERLDSFISTLFKERGEGKENSEKKEKLNKGESRKQSFSSKFKNKFRKSHAKDYRLYEEALKLSK